jgi:hypothetical protein
VYTYISASIACLHGRLNVLFICSLYLFIFIYLIFIYFIYIYFICYYLFVYLYLLYIYFLILIYLLFFYLFIYIYSFIFYFYHICGPGSSVVIATELRAGLSRIEFLWGQNIPSVQTGPGTHPASCKMGTESFLGVKSGRGVLLITHPLPVLRSWKSRIKPLPSLWATPGL